MAFDPNTYKNDWSRQHLDRIALVVPKGEKAAIQSHAAARGESLNGFIRRAIGETMQRDTDGAPAIDETMERDE